MGYHVKLVQPGHFRNYLLKFTYSIGPMPQIQFGHTNRSYNVNNLNSELDFKLFHVIRHNIGPLALLH